MFEVIAGSADLKEQYDQLKVIASTINIKFKHVLGGKRESRGGYHLSISKKEGNERRKERI
jgi:hypothetical protein